MWKNEFSPALESVEGVASVSATRRLEESVQVTMDQDKIDALMIRFRKRSRNSLQMREGTG